MLSARQNENQKKAQKTQANRIGAREYRTRKKENESGGRGGRKAARHQVPYLAIIGSVGPSSSLYNLVLKVNVNRKFKVNHKIQAFLL